MTTAAVVCAVPHPQLTREELRVVVARVAGGVLARLHAVGWRARRRRGSRRGRPAAALGIVVLDARAALRRAADAVRAVGCRYAAEAEAVLLGVRCGRPSSSNIRGILSYFCISVHSCGRGDGVGQRCVPFFALPCCNFVGAPAPASRPKVPARRYPRRRGSRRCLSFGLIRVRNFAWAAMVNERCTRNWWIVGLLTTSCTRGRDTGSLHIPEAAQVASSAAGWGCPIARPQRSRDHSTCGWAMNRSGRSASNSRGPATPSTSVRTRVPKRGGHIIAAIASQEEFDAVFDVVTGGGLQGGWPGGCAFVGLHRCNAQETWRWTTGDAGTDGPWGDGEPNDWAGSEDCGMICYHIDGGLNDGPCHNTIHCICEEGLEDLVRYDEGQCPEPDWAGWYTLAFLLGFFFWLCAIYGCAGLPQMCSTHKNFANGLCLGIVLFCILLSALWEYIVEACYGMNAGIHVSARRGGCWLSRGDRARGVHAPSDGSRQRRIFTKRAGAGDGSRRAYAATDRADPSAAQLLPRNARPGADPRRPHCQRADSSGDHARPDHIRGSPGASADRQQRGNSGRGGVPSGACERGAAGRGTVRHLPGCDPGRPRAATLLARVPSRVPRAVAPRPGAPVLPDL